MQSHSKVDLLTKIGMHAVLILVAITCLYPLAWMFLSSLKTQKTIFKNMSLFTGEMHFENYLYAWKNGNFDVYFLNSVIYTLITIFFIVFFASMAAYAFSRLQFPGRDILFYVFIGVMMIPIPGAFVAIFVILKKMGLIDTRLGYLLPQINAGIPFAIYMLKTFFDKMPKELEDSAEIDGCNKWQVYLHVALPLAKPALAVIIIFQALTVWNEFLLAKLVLNTQDLMPLQVGLLNFQGMAPNYPHLMAGMGITMLPMIIVYLVMQKFIIKGITAGAVVG